MIWDAIALIMTSLWLIQLVFQRPFAFSGTALTAGELLCKKTVKESTFAPETITRKPHLLWVINTIMKGILTLGYIEVFIVDNTPWFTSFLGIIWRHWCQKQVSQAGISNNIPPKTVGCNYLSMPEIPTSGTTVVIHVTLTWAIIMYNVIVGFPVVVI